MRSFLLVLVTLFFLPNSYASYDVDKSPLAITSLLLATVWLDDYSNTVVFYDSPLYDQAVEYPPGSDSDKQGGFCRAQSESDKQSVPFGFGCKKLSIKLDKILINDGDGDGGKQVVYCQLCCRRYATGHLACCHHPVCRHCQQQSDGDGCPLCRCCICFSPPAEEWLTPCCKKISCKQCFDRVTLTTTLCPFCKWKACDTPGRTDLSRNCQLCKNWVPKSEYSQHLLSEHPVSDCHIWDYTFCDLCTVYINPALWTEHSRRLHGQNGVREARTQALVQILTRPTRRVAGDNKLPMETERLCQKPDEEPEGPAPSEPELISCPICHDSIPGNQMHNHIMQADHDVSNVPTLWHSYCRYSQAYIRNDLYYYQNQ